MAYLKVYYNKYKAYMKAAGSNLPLRTNYPPPLKKWRIRYLQQLVNK